MKLPNPFDGDINDDLIEDWLNQFDDSDRPLILRLLEGFRYYSSRKVNHMVKDLYASVCSCLNTSCRAVWFVPVGYVAKSGSIIAYYFRMQNNLPQDRFLAPDDIGSLDLASDTAVVFLDDFVGSGNQARQVWQNVVLPVTGLKLAASFIYAVLVANKLGLENIQSSTGLLPLAVEVIQDEARPFSDKSTVFTDQTEREMGKEVAKKYGEILYPNHPLGYNDSQGLLGFFYSTPNNTLPIFWSSEGGWKPLLAHGESYSNPSFLIAFRVLVSIQGLICR